MHLKGIPGMDLVNPNPMFSPHATYAASALEDDPLVGQDNSNAMRVETFKKVIRDDIKYTLGMFNVLKRPDEVTPQCVWRPCTNLNNINMSIRTNYFWLPMLMELTTYLKRGLW